MRIPTQKAPARSSRPSRRMWLLVAGAAAAVGVLTLAVFKMPLVGYARHRVYELGFLADHSWTGHRYSDVPYAARNWASSLFRSTEVPRIAVDIKFRHILRLRGRRRAALERGLLTQREDEYVPARIRSSNRRVRAKVRLKGDVVAGQFDEDSWSFRVHIKDDDHLFGMRRFNLHPALARDFHTEPLFLEHVRHIGVLAPRYKFVHVVLNGDDLGVMAIEEHFSKELLESQARREGVILKIDESRYFSFRRREERLASPFGSFLTAELAPFRESRVSEDPVLSNQHRIATSLYRAFVEGSMAPSDVFDARLVGRFLAVVQVWEAWHAASWRNIRFYYNPITARLEPIAYDAELISVGYHTPEPLHGRMLKDPEIRASYVAALRAMAAKAPWSLPEEQLIKEQRRLLGFLHRSFPFLKPMDIVALADKAAQSLSEDPLDRVQIHPLREGEQTSHEIDPSRFRPRDLAWIHFVQDDGATFLELRNLVEFPITVSRRAPRDESAGSEESPSALETLAVIPPTPFGELPSVVRIALDDSTPVDRVFVSAVGVDTGAWVQPTRYFPKALGRPIPSPSLEAVSDHDFLEYDAATRTVTSLPGKWDVRGTISLPRGVTLVLRPGTELRFPPDAALIIRGPSHFAGTLEKRVILRGKDGQGTEGWRGVAAFNTDSSATWSFVRIMDTSGVAYEDWQLTGGVTVHEGQVSIENAEFLNNTAEDALNLVRTSFALRDVSVQGAASDGVDVDFGTGTVEGGSFSEIGWIGGGDGLDFSGCRARVSAGRFSRIDDKAVSVGERSQVRLEGLTIHGAGVGAVSKDGSYVDIRGSVVSETRYAALMAYSKKKEFGGAVLDAANLTTKDVDRLGAAQRGSLLRINGEPVESADFDVDRLYGTIMSKGGEG